MTRDEIMKYLKDWAYSIGYFDLILMGIEESSEELRNKYLTKLENQNFSGPDDMYQYLIDHSLKF